MVGPVPRMILKLKYNVDCFWLQKEKVKRDQESLRELKNI